MQRTVLRLLAVLAALVVGSCSAAGQAPPPGSTTSAASAGPAQPERAEWQQLELPDGALPLTLVSTAGRLLVGSRVAGRPTPAGLDLLEDDQWSEVPLTPATGYGRETAWLGMVAEGGHVYAVGGIAGGAHANTRVTTWSGSLGALLEHQQPFATFGGWGAGDVGGIALAGAEPIVFGSWGSDAAGLDLAVWRAADLPDATVWRRQPSTGTALAATRERLPSAQIAVPAAEGLLWPGSITRLEPGSVSTHPALWVLPSSSGAWREIDLDDDGAQGEALAAGCSQRECLVLGRLDGRLASWAGPPSSPTTPGSVPGLHLDDSAAVPPLVTVGDDLVAAVPVEGATRLVVRSADGQWRDLSGPAGVPRALAAHSGRVYLVTAAASGATSLWWAEQSAVL